jgi:hypothetical protein
MFMQDKSRHWERTYTVPHVDDTIDALLEEVLQNATAERRPTAASPSAPQGWLARFFGSLAASMALQRGKSWTPYGHQPIQSPADILAQKYPHIYLRVMCG